MILIGLLAILGLLFLSQILINPKNYLVSQVGNLVSRPMALLSSLIEISRDSAEFEKLLRENEVLKAKILLLSKSSYRETIGGHEYLSAKIYSTYPFNNRGLITLNAGRLDGLKELLPVTVGETIFLGQLTQVSDTSSVARTIFDAGWELPVKAGTGGVDALLLGGREPRLTLIVKEKELVSGADVYTAGKDFPYGLKIGTIKEIFDNPGSTFREATLDIPYAVGELTQVSVLIK